MTAGIIKSETSRLMSLKVQWMRVRGGEAAELEFTLHFTPSAAQGEMTVHRNKGNAGIFEEALDGGTSHLLLHRLTAGELCSFSCGTLLLLCQIWMCFSGQLSKLFFCRHTEVYKCVPRFEHGCKSTHVFLKKGYNSPLQLHSHLTAFTCVPVFVGFSTKTSPWQLSKLHLLIVTMLFLVKLST